MDKKLLEGLLQNVENKDDIINQIYSEHGKEVNKLKADFEAVKAEKLELSQKLDGYKDYDALKEANAQLTKQIEETKLAQEKQVKDNALNELIKSSNVKDARAIKGFIDETKLTWNEESKSWQGLSEQLDVIKKEQAYLFNDTSNHKNVNPTDSDSNVSAETLALRNL